LVCVHALARADQWRLWRVAHAWSDGPDAENATEILMAERIALVRERVRRRTIVCAALVSLLAGVLLAPALSAAPHSSGALAPVAASSQSAGSPAALANLSTAERASISAAVAATQPAYRIDAGGAGLQAQNPTQHLQLAFSRSGAHVSAAGLDLGLTLTAAGDGGSLHALGAATPRASANRVTYSHGSVTESYVNGTLGVEQGFTVASDPAPATSGPLTLALSTSGDTSAALAANGQSVTFSSFGGPALRYGALSTTDASGRSLRTWLTLDGKRLLLHVDRRDARFPLHVDPLLEQDPEAPLVATLGEQGNSFGRSVAISADGNTAIVGGPGGIAEAGAAWVFTRTGTVWKQQGEKLNVPMAEGEGQCSEEAEEAGEVPEECALGWSVALSADGNTALLGAPRAVPAQATEEEGAAWTFTRSAEGKWTLGAELTAPGGSPKGHFGRSVALSANGATALIGAPTAGSGRAWVFTHSASGWSSPSSLAAAEENGDSRFGRSVALSGDGETALVGGPGDDDGLGAAWFFSGVGGTWTGDGGKTIGTGVTAEGHFGFSVALSADASTALIGAFQQNGDQGAAWTYSRSGQSWSELGEPLAGDGEEELFGYAVALSPTGTTALVGAPRAKGSRGATWLYGRSGATWTPERELLGGEQEGTRAKFGSSVAMSADAVTLLVGGPRERLSGGAAWVFGRGPSVENVSPAGGPAAGGTTVTISGEHLAGATAVRFGATPATSFTVLSEKSISAVSPAGAGIVDVTVETGYGVSLTGAHDTFSYKVSTGKSPQMPSIEGVSPREGPAGGGTVVTISGEHLLNTTAVSFGSTRAASFTANSEHSITAVSPAGSGTVDVTAEDSAGTSGSRAADHFTYRAAKGGGSTTETTEQTGKIGILGSGPTSGGLAGGGPLASSAVAGCGVVLLSKILSVQPHSRAVLKLAGIGLGKCGGKVRLRVRRRLANHHIGIKTIGTAVFTVLAGKHLAVKIHLNATGRKMLAARHGKLNASILIVRSTPAPSVARTASVRVRVPKHHAVKAPVAKRP
jgi:IPT/TIG domain/FG-GAP repeat